MSDNKSETKKAKKPSNGDRLDALETANGLLKQRIEELERNQKVIVDGYEFAANEIRPLYGFGAIAQIFDAIHRKLAE